MVHLQLLGMKNKINKNNTITAEISNMKITILE